MIISVTVTASVEQVVAGIPRFVSITANDSSATIFYTLDGTQPDMSSTIYTGAIQLPTDQLVITLNVIAIDGSSSSPVITYIYQTTFTGANSRFPRSGSNAAVNAPPTNDPYPFGTPPIQPNQNFTGTNTAGYNTDDPSLPQYADGYDGFGNQAGFTNEPLIGIPTKTLPVILSSTDAEGQSGYGIGTLPPVRVMAVKPIPETSVVGSNTFDPRALVTFQDSTLPPDPNSPTLINRQFFTLEDVNHTRTGNQYYNTALDAPPVSGAFLRQHYNPKDQTMTYYYFDSTQNRWMINKTSFVPTKDNSISNYWNVVPGRWQPKGADKVYQWITWKGNWLY